MGEQCYSSRPIGRGVGAGASVYYTSSTVCEFRYGGVFMVMFKRDVGE